MNMRRMIGAAAALGLALAVAAQNVGRISGTVYDLNSKPWPGVSIEIKSEQSGTSYTTKTDKKGQYVQVGLASGIYTITFRNDEARVNYEVRVRVGMGGPDDVTQDVNFKEVISKNPQYTEAMKKQEEEKQKYENMKAHFQNGVAAMNEAQQVKGSLATVAPDQKTTLQAKLSSLYQTAITEFQAAEQAAGPKEPNLALVLANLGVAYESAGNYQEAANYFQKATELKPTQANYFLSLGTNLARVGKMAEAGSACDKAAALDPANPAACWRNVGIVLYNENKVKEAVEPLRKASQLDPKNADTWYLLGAALLNTMGSKVVGGKIVPVIAPGTAEAYQKCLELAPNGPHAAEAQAALDTLKSLGAGVETKVSTKKKK